MFTFSHVSIAIGLCFIVFAFYRLRSNERRIPRRSTCIYDETGKPLMWSDEEED